MIHRKWRQWYCSQLVWEMRWFKNMNFWQQILWQSLFPSFSEPAAYRQQSFTRCEAFHLNSVCLTGFSLSNTLSKMEPRTIVRPADRANQASLLWWVIDSFYLLFSPKFLSSSSIGFLKSLQICDAIKSESTILITFGKKHFNLMKFSLNFVRSTK